METKLMQKIENMIYIIRGMKVMLDSDLAELYEVETKVLNQAVKRNIERFPQDFMFKLSYQEVINLKSQIVTSSSHGGRRKLPMVFTENGVAMLSGILKSERAISVNIAIMRTFTSMRKVLQSDESLSEKISQLENDSKEMKKIFQIVFEKLNFLEGKVPSLPKDRKKIGLKK